MLARLMTTVEASIEFFIVALISERVNTRGCCALCSYYIYAVFIAVAIQGADNTEQLCH